MSSKLPTSTEVVALLKKEGRPMHIGEVAAKAQVRKDLRRRFADLMEDWARQGTIASLGGGRYRAPTAAPQRSSEQGWQGQIQVNAKGFGFVAAVGHDDVFVPAEALGPALHGDTVRVVVVRKTARGVEGRVDGVVKRRNPRIAGTLIIRKKHAWLEPDDARVRGPIAVHSGHESARDGSAAVVEITRFPATHDENPEGKVISILGEPGDPRVEVKKILLREQVEEEHPEAAIREAERVARQTAFVPSSQRKDLRDVPFLTIDPEDARDHDDAICAERHGDGFRVYVAIADVSEYVQPGSPLDEEALKRSFTLYLPDRAVPMLPSALAGNVCSLLPDRDRLALCVIVSLDAEGTVRKVEITEAVIRVAAYLTYGGVACTLGFTEKPGPNNAADAFKKDLKVLDEIARKLRTARLRRGALDLDLPEAKLTLDPQTGIPTWVGRRAQDPGVKRAYQVVEEFMLLANETVARWLSGKKCPAIYRVHGKPDETKLDRLGEVCTQLGIGLDLSELSEAAGVSRWLAKLKKHPRGAVIEGLLLRSLKQAVYDTNNIGHFGLASGAYLHFTSPIRRYPDLLVHRTVKHLLRGGSIDESPSAIEQLQMTATLASGRERAVMQIEREVVDLYRAIVMKDHIGESFDGTVSAVVGTGVFVALDDPFVDVLVRYEALGPDHYELDDMALTAVGQRSGDKVMVGDRMRVEIIDVALLRRSVYGTRVIPAELLRRFKNDLRVADTSRASTRIGPHRVAPPSTASRVAMIVMAQGVSPVRSVAAGVNVGIGKSSSGFGCSLRGRRRCRVCPARIRRCLRRAHSASG
ncbi:MAG TPA: ribonuclease R [Polyangiaceae bacterium]|nr:ribonuclease R [Polyangiaceae bacterium]